MKLDPMIMSLIKEAMRRCAIMTDTAEKVVYIQKAAQFIFSQWEGIYQETIPIDPTKDLLADVFESVAKLPEENRPEVLSYIWERANSPEQVAKFIYCMSQFDEFDTTQACLPWLEKLDPDFTKLKHLLNGTTVEQKGGFFSNFNYKICRESLKSLMARCNVSSSDQNEIEQNLDKHFTRTKIDLIKRVITMIFSRWKDIYQETIPIPIDPTKDLLADVFENVAKLPEENRPEVLSYIWEQANSPEQVAKFIYCMSQFDEFDTTQACLPWLEKLDPDFTKLKHLLNGTTVAQKCDFFSNFNYNICRESLKLLMARCNVSSSDQDRIEQNLGKHFTRTEEANILINSARLLPEDRAAIMWMMQQVNFEDGGASSNSTPNLRL